MEARNNTQNLTVEQLLVITKENVLGEISVPMKYDEQIRKPIGEAMHNLQLCVDAIRQAAKQAQKPAPESEPENEVELVGVGNIDDPSELPEGAEPLN